MAGSKTKRFTLSPRGTEIQVQYYAGSSATGTLLRNVTKDYASEIDPVSGNAANRRQIRETTTLDNGLVSKIETDYEMFTCTYSMVYGLGSDAPSPFAMDSVSRLGLPEACPLLLQSERAIQKFSVESNRAPRQELQSALAALNCK
jgi:hypothetical protein